jgi:hypothetical protein
MYEKKCLNKNKEIDYQDEKKLFNNLNCVNNTHN